MSIYHIFNVNLLYIQCQSIIYSMSIYHIFNVNPSYIQCQSIIYSMSIYHIFNVNLSYIQCQSIIYSMSIHHIFNVNHNTLKEPVPSRFQRLLTKFTQYDCINVILKQLQRACLLMYSNLLKSKAFLL
jgi:uncharacterized protein YfbU (UPF0304 family)